MNVSDLQKEGTYYLEDGTPVVYKGYIQGKYRFETEGDGDIKELANLDDVYLKPPSMR